MIPGARLVLLGRQGAGKGTQCARLSRHYVVPHISTGDMLRAAVREGTEFGRKAEEYMSAGELLPDDIMVGIVDERLERDDTRTHYSVDLPPKYDMVCDVCGGDVVQRDDDTEKAIAQRLALYDRETEPLIEWFSGKGLLDVVDGTGNPDDVTDRLVRTIDRRR